jgi:hypothetical protein
MLRATPLRGQDGSELEAPVRRLGLSQVVCSGRLESALVAPFPSDVGEFPPNRTGRRLGTTPAFWRAAF